MILGSDHFFPKESSIEELDGFSVYVMTNLKHGILFEIPSIDLESHQWSSQYDQLRALLRELPEQYEVKLQHEVNLSNECNDDSFRSKSIKEIGFIKRKLLLSIETMGKDPFGINWLYNLIGANGGKREKTSVKLVNSIPRNQLLALGARALSKNETQKVLSLCDAQVKVSKDFLDFGSKVLGTLRLYRQGTQPINEETLAYLIQSLPLPFQLCISAKKISKTIADIRLRSLLNRQDMIGDIGMSEKKEEIANALRSTILQDSSIFEMEWLLVLERQSEQELRNSVGQALSILRPLGDVMIETVGGANSYLASRFGGKQHFTFTELDSIAAFYLPIGSFGEASLVSPLNEAAQKRALLAHRDDNSLHSFDLFNPKFFAYNALISGKTGSGKSVMGGLLSSSLLSDPSIVLTKMDVGGSYEKECEIFGGQSINFSLDEASGLNPFKIFHELRGNKDAISTLAEFLASLVREEQEVTIPKMMKAEIEASLLRYSEHLTESAMAPSLDSFLDVTPQFPRANLLRRWTSQGVFGNALKESDQTLAASQSRYKYFNFKNIHGAANRDYADGIMAAVITQVNLEMIKIAINPTSQKKFVFFCDETKFFIDRHADFFLLTVGNFRKFGHAVILMAQNMMDFVVTGADGKSNGGIITNSPTRIYFETDLPEEFLRDRCQLNRREIDALTQNPYRGSDYRCAVLQDDTGSRLVRLYLTPSELWRVTSKSEHTFAYQKLRKAVPELTAEEAIHVLSLKEVI